MDDPRDRQRSAPDLDTELHVSPTRLASYWGVHVDTVYRDIRKGALKAFRVGSGRQFRIRTSDAKRYGRPVE